MGATVVVWLGAWQLAANAKARAVLIATAIVRKDLGSATGIVDLDGICNAR